MKISEMLKREDFYAINMRTLNSYFSSVNGQHTDLYVYPYLNVIVTKHPSKHIKDYLFTEYRVKSAVKRLIIYSYITICMESCGLFSSKKIRINADISDELMIYPCNKKYRIFNFENGTVCVIVKDGFSDKDILHEIDFRVRAENPLFVPKLLNNSNNSYSETIIDGGSIARVTDAELKEQLKMTAYHLFREQYKQEDKQYDAEIYLQNIEDRISKLLKIKVKDITKTLEAVSKLRVKASSLNNISVVFSHGDLQAGNIWSDKNGDIYIIDWESWDERSVWYDYDTLFNTLRPGNIDIFLMNNNIDDYEKAVVVLEDIVFQLEELNSLPGEFGLDKYNNYIDKVMNWLRGFK